jgi:uncharacterized protein (TIGR03083 family)
MNTTVIPVDTVTPIGRDEAATLAAQENERMLELLRSLSADDWTRPTDCTGWDVRSLAGHLLGAVEGFSSFGNVAHMMRAAKKAAARGPLVDGMTASQVRERAALSTTELIDRFAAARAKSVEFRAGFPRLLRKASTKQELLSGATEKWTMGYLLDIVLTRDMWMHRVDISRAVGRQTELTPEHDGRIVADVIAEWARRHGRSFSLELTGPLAATYTRGDDGESITIDPVEMCRIFSGRAHGDGLLTQEVPF